MPARARRAVLAVAALALALAACQDTVGSLTPFGLGKRGEDTDQGTFSGAWSGTTTGDGLVTFTVTSGEVIDLLVTHTLDCGLPLKFEFTDAILIQNDGFTARRNLDPQGSVVLRGSFTSPDTATGSYVFSSLATSAQCPTSGAGSFTAKKTPPAN